MAVPPWKAEIIQLLGQRDLTQCKAFAIIEHYTKLLSRERQLAADNATLQQKLHDLTLRVTAGIGLPVGPSETPAFSSEHSSPTNSPASSSSDLLLYKKLAEIQEETRSLSQQLAAAKLEASQKNEELTKLLDKVALGDKHLREKDEEMQQMQMTIGILKEELQALQVVLVTNDEKLKELSREKSDLVNELMKKAQQNAELANKMLDLEARLAAAQAGQPLVQPGPQSMTMSTTGTDAPVPLQRPLPSKAKRIITSHQSEVFAVVYNPYGTTLASGGTDKLIRLWETNQFTSKGTLQGAIQSITAIDFSSDDSLVLGASNDNAIRVWHQGTQRLRHTLNGHTNKVYGAVFSGDSNKVVTGSHDRTLKVWDLGKGFCIRTIFCYSACNAVSVSADGLIASGHVDTSLRLWDLRNGDCLADINQLHTGQISSVTMAPAHIGQLVLTNSRDHSLKLVDARTHEVVQTYRADQYRNGSHTNKAVFSPDGNFVAAGGNDGSIFIWERQTGKLQSTLRNGHKTTVSAIAWNPVNMSQITSADKNGVIIVWE